MVTARFALPIAISAFLLFAVEPMVGRLVLPAFGGAPAVWATTLFFFQAVLLAGYSYGHISITRFGRHGPRVHLVLALAALAALLLAPVAIAPLRVDGQPPVLNLLWILSAVVGLPAFVLTATTPLLSGWFVAGQGGQPRDPYWLYALSNAGSLLALLAYPLVIEPRIGLATQRGLWTIGFAGLVFLIGLAAWRTTPGGSEPVPRDNRAAASRIGWARRLRWLLLAAVPSGLLAAVTNFIATDLVSAPMLWVIPLAVYLASFVVAFSPRAVPVVTLAGLAAPAAITILWLPYAVTVDLPLVPVLLVELVGFAVIATGLHGRLALDRPEPARLTEFYLVISIGGALASAFVAILAPAVFADVWEYPILLVLALVGLALSRGGAPSLAGGRRVDGLDFGPFVAGFRGRVLPYAVAAGGLLALLIGGRFGVVEPAIWLAIGGLLLVAGGRAGFLALTTTLVLVIATLSPGISTEYRARSFFGVTEVRRDGEQRLLMNGTTLHGIQSTDPGRRRIPTTYYGELGPAGDIFEVGASGASGAGWRVGLVGLGAGTLAAYQQQQPSMAMTFFEIDPVVIAVASDPTWFTFLADAPDVPVIVEGDARLSLAKQPDTAFDLLVLDAFSSDTIPVHLLTREAVRDEIRTVATDGLIAFHISNRYYQLSAPIAAALAEQGLSTLERASRPEETAGDPGLFPSRWLVATRNASTLEAFRSLGWSEVAPADRPFTDDYADLLSYLDLGL